MVGCDKTHSEGKRLAVHSIRTGRNQTQSLNLNLLNLNLMQLLGHHKEMAANLEEENKALVEKMVGLYTCTCMH